MSPIEVVGTIFGLASVLLTVWASVWCWPTSIVNIVLFLIMFWRAKLYGDVLNYAVLLILCIYGWYEWLRGGESRAPLPIAFASRRVRIVAVAVCALGAPAMGFAFDRWTDAALPYWDSVIAVLSLVAQVLLARKLVENWILWIIVDVLGVGVYFAKQLYLTSGLYFLFLILASIGLVKWLRQA
jgi:nicotinamide mononucleotide transporter